MWALVDVLLHNTANQWPEIMMSARLSVDSPPTMTARSSYNPQLAIKRREDNTRTIHCTIKGAQLCKGGSYVGALYNGGIMQGPQSNTASHKGLSAEPD